MAERITIIDLNNAGRVIILNDGVYLLSEEKFTKFFEIGKPTPKIIKLVNEKERIKEHYKLCEKIRKSGKFIGYADRILRDD